MAEKEGGNIHFICRLASYNYFNMDQAIKNLLDYYNDRMTILCNMLYLFMNMYIKVGSYCIMYSGITHNA